MSKANISINGMDVQIVRKKIKNLHLSVCPPDGYVRVSAPEHISDDNVRLMVVSKLPWINKQRKRFQAQPRQSARQYLSGECHYFLGQAYRLEVIETTGKQSVTIKQSGKISLSVRPNASVASKQKLLDDFYRQALKQGIPELLAKWEPRIGHDVSFWGIKKMKTKWGSCNPSAKRIWLNLELAKKPAKCLEYVLVHELTHLLEASHNARFKAFMSDFLPNWQSLQAELNAQPVRHEEWARDLKELAL